MGIETPNQKLERLNNQLNKISTVTEDLQEVKTDIKKLLKDQEINNEIKAIDFSKTVKRTNKQNIILKIVAGIGFAFAGDWLGLIGVISGIL